MYIYIVYVQVMVIVNGLHIQYICMCIHVCNNTFLSINVAKLTASVCVFLR